MKRTIYVVALRHPTHVKNVVAQSEREKLVTLGTRYAAGCVPKIVRVVAGPMLRAVEGAIGFLEGYGNMLPLHAVTPEFGDVTQGKFPLTPDEVGLAKAMVDTDRCSIEHALLHHPALADKMRKRGEEAGQAALRFATEYLDDNTEESDVAILIGGHGGRHEPMLAWLSGVGYNSLPFEMATGTLAMCKMVFDTEERSFSVYPEQVIYLGDLSESKRAEATPT